MIDIRTLRRTGFALTLGLGLAACAQPTSSPPPQQTGGMSGMGSQGMAGHNMSGMNMDQMMARCSEMHQQMRSGATMSSDMRAMMAHCDQMYPQAGTAGAAPAAGQRRR
jgi:hypothetical protein